MSHLQAIKSSLKIEFVNKYSKSWLLPLIFNFKYYFIDIKIDLSLEILPV